MLIEYHISISVSLNCLLYVEFLANNLQFFSLCLIMERLSPKHVAKSIYLGCPLSKADRGPTKLLRFSFQSPTIWCWKISWLEINHDGNLQIYKNGNQKYVKGARHHKIHTKMKIWVFQPAFVQIMLRDLPLNALWV